MIHELKTWSEFMIDVATGKKPFEVRKNDRNYTVEDTLLLRAWDKERNQYTGYYIDAEITYVLHGGQFGIEEGYVVLGIKIINYNM